MILKLITGTAFIIFFNLNWATTSVAQNLDDMMQQNLAQQRTTDAQLNQIMQQGEARGQNFLNNYIESDRPQLEAERQQYIRKTGNQISLEQFAGQKVDAEANRINSQIAPNSNP